MQAKNRLKGMTLAAAAATLFVVTPITASAGAHESAEPAEGKCIGGNACKGQSACATANTSCKGQNSCKGQGFTKTTEAACEEAGGEFEQA